MNKNIKVIDYSLENIILLNNHQNLIYFPYQCENDKLIPLISIPKLYDIVFIGLISSRRNYICEEIQKKGIRVLNMNSYDKWGDVRDKEISQAKILLNIHFAENYMVYEALRCDRWILAGH